jgi:hypothetical protein
MNRSERRAFDKAVRCVEHGTKVPGGVLGQVAPARLDRMAKLIDRRVDGRGFVKPITA